MNEDLQKGFDIPEDYDRFRVGVTVFEHDPAKEHYRNMLHLVAYDIRDPARLRRVAKVCEDYGIRVEYSVFECDLSQELFQGLWASLRSHGGHDTGLSHLWLVRATDCQHGSCDPAGKGFGLHGLTVGGRRMRSKWGVRRRQHKELFMHDFGELE